MSTRFASRRKESISRNEEATRFLKVFASRRKEFVSRRKVFHSRNIPAGRLKIEFAS